MLRNRHERVMRAPLSRYVFTTALLIGLIGGCSDPYKMEKAYDSKGDEACAGETVAEAHSLKRLPDRLREQLPKSHGLDGLADRGEGFNPTDVVNSALPMQRFVLAAVGRSCAVLAVQFGGIVNGFKLSEYHLSDLGSWQAVGCHLVFQEPTSARELLTKQKRVTTCEFKG